MEGFSEKPTEACAGKGRWGNGAYHSCTCISILTLVGVGLANLNGQKDKNKGVIREKVTWSFFKLEASWSV